MANRGHQLIHADAFAAELEALGLDSSIFGAAGVPAPVFANMIPRRAGVFDVLPNTHGFADFSTAFTRASDALYRDPNGKWQTAGTNGLRADHDANRNFLGFLIEPESVNKCTNYNLNPDSGLTNLLTSGDPAGVLSRVTDATELASAGFDELSADQFVIKADNSGGSVAFFIIPDGVTGNTNQHTASVYGRDDASTPGKARIKCGGTGASTYFNSSSYVRKSATNASPAAGDRLQLGIDAGGIAYFLLNQLEEDVLATSPIVTVGASATRAVDVLKWPLANYLGTDFLNQSAGMCCLRWRSGFSNADGSNQFRMLRWGAALSEMIYYQAPAGDAVRNWDGSGGTVSSVAIPGGLAQGQEIWCAVRWGSSKKQIGIKTGGTWTWSTEDAYDGTFDESNFIEVSPMSGAITLPSHFSHLFIWDQDAGTSFLEKFATPFCN